MSAWSDHDYRDDRAEALGEARTYFGNPEPCDDSFWLGVNVRADAMARTTGAALAAVDSVIGLLPSVEGEPAALGSACGADNRASAASTEQPPSPSATLSGAA